MPESSAPEPNETATPAPQHAPSPRELDDLELISHGALPQLTGFEGPDGLVTLHVPRGIAEAAAAAGALELVDPEGVPLATVSVESTYEADESGELTGITGPVTPITHNEFGAFRRLYLSPTQVKERYDGAHADRSGRRPPDQPGPGPPPDDGRRTTRSCSWRWSALGPRRTCPSPACCEPPSPPLTCCPTPTS